MDIAVVGAGIVGLAVARALSLHPRRSLAVLEREAEIASHQTGHNSGVVHAGIYYAPGSLKARLCVAGARELYEFCDEHGVPYEHRGKLIVARHPGELRRLEELEGRGRANGVPGLRRVDASGLREIEPHCRGVAALHSPATGVVDFSAVAAALAAELRERSVPVVTDCTVTGVAQRSGRIALRHRQGETTARFAVFCAGLWSDRIAVSAGAPAEPRIVPFRGAYLRLRPERSQLVRGLIYPVPDPSLPFLGVHLSRHLDGSVTVGPTALPAPGRQLAGTLAWPGTWRLARRWWRTGVRELAHATSRRLLARTASGYVPELRASDLERGFVGVRAQAVDREGRLIDDFVVSRSERALHVRNAPSPAATASLALGRLIADQADEGLR